MEYGKQINQQASIIKWIFIVIGLLETIIVFISFPIEFGPLVALCILLINVFLGWWYSIQLFGFAEIVKFCEESNVVRDRLTKKKEEKTE